MSEGRFKRWACRRSIEYVDCLEYFLQSGTIVVNHVMVSDPIEIKHELLTITSSRKQLALKIGCQLLHPSESLRSTSIIDLSKSVRSMISRRNRPVCVHWSK